MKKVFYILGTIISLYSCIPLLDDTSDLPITGMWASIDNDGFTSQYIEFRNGQYNVFESAQSGYYADETIWAVKKSDYQKIIQQEYSIINGTLHLDNYTAPISISENTLSIGNQTFYKLSDFTSKYYSKITCDHPEDLIFTYTSTEVSWNYHIDNRPLGDKVNMTSNVDWIKSIAVTKENLSFKIEENNSGKNRKAILTLSYPTASSIQIELEQTYSESQILLDPKSTSCDYTGGTFDFYYEINHPRDGQTATISCTSEWITEITDADGRVSFTISENNSGNDRSDDILITYGSISETHKVNQSYSPAHLNILPESMTTDYKGGRYSAFSCMIENPRKGWTLNAKCDADWIKHLTINQTSDTNYTIELEVLENNSEELLRTAIIDITYGDATTQFKITQTSDAPKITLSDGGQSCDYQAKEYSFSYSIENPRESFTPTVTCKADWIIGLNDNNGNVRFSVGENNTGYDREAEIRIDYGTAYAEYIVQQEYLAPQVFLYTEKDK
jgi:hypothetical protein